MSETPDQGPAAAQIADAVGGAERLAAAAPEHDAERRDAAGEELAMPSGGSQAPSGEDPGDMQAHGGDLAGGDAHP
jgi:hypothetical protein